MICCSACLKTIVKPAQAIGIVIIRVPYIANTNTFSRPNKSQQFIFQCRVTSQGIFGMGEPTAANRKYLNCHAVNFRCLKLANLVAASNSTPDAEHDLPD